MSPNTDPLLIIANPQAGRFRAAKTAQKAARTLQKHGVKTEIALSKSPEETRETAAKAAKNRAAAVAVCGGDGSAHAAANALAHTETALAIIPAGRANDFARALRIPLRTEDAALLIAETLQMNETERQRRIRKIDLGNVNGTRFCTVAAFGIDAQISRMAMNAQQTYLQAALAQAWSFKPIPARIRGAFGTRTAKVTLCAAANAPAYGKRFQIAPGAKMDDGKLNFCVIAETNRFQRLRLLVQIMKGTHIRRGDVEIRAAAAFHIETDEPQPVFADGEPAAHTPADYAVEPGALLALSNPATKNAPFTGMNAPTPASTPESDPL